MPTKIALEVFDLKELSDEPRKGAYRETPRQRAMSKLREIAAEMWDGELETEFWRDEKLAPLGFEDAEIRYSGFGSQGDGASFTCKHINLVTWIGNNPEFLPLLDWTDYLNAAIVADRYPHYVHANTIACKIEDDNVPEELADMVNDMEAAITAEARDLSRQIYRALEDDYNGQMSDEAIADMAEANEYKFLASGAIAPRGTEIEEN